MLLSNMLGDIIEETTIENVKQRMFSCANELYVLSDKISDSNVLQEIRTTIMQYLDDYGCFEAQAMWDHFKNVLNEDIIINVSNFEQLINFLVGDDCHFRSYYSTEFGKVPRIGFDNTFKKCVDKIENIVCNEYNGTLTEDEQTTYIFGFSENILKRIFLDYSSNLYYAEINGICCIQAADYMGLPENLAEVITNVIGKMEGADIELNISSIHTALSLELGKNFMKEYEITDDYTFKSIVQRNCLITPRHCWDRNIFRRVNE